MKKLIALVLACLMVLGCTAAFAEEAQTLELNWEVFAQQIEAASEETKAAWAGDFVTMDEIAMKIYVPDSFQQLELTDEDREEGYIAYFTLGEEAAVAIQYVDMDGMELEEYAQLLTGEQGVEECVEAVVNGLPALAYSFTEEDSDTSVLACSTEKGYILEAVFSPTNDEGFAAVATVMMGSIQAAE